MLENSNHTNSPTLSKRKNLMPYILSRNIQTWFVFLPDILTPTSGMLVILQSLVGLIRIKVMAV